jgi:MFS family permease
MSPAALAAAAIALSAPVFVFSVFGGLAADFVDRKKLLVSTQIAASVPALILCYLTATDKASVEWIIALAAMTGVVNAFEYPARHAMTAEIVTRDKLTSAVTLQAVAFNATRMIGSSAAGFIIVVSSPAICFLINFVSYLTGALLYSMIEQEAASTGGDSVKNTRSIADGIKFILKRRDITGVLIIVAAVSLFGIPFIPMLPLFAEGVLHSGADGYNRGRFHDRSHNSSLYAGDKAQRTQYGFLCVLFCFFPFSVCQIYQPVFFHGGTGCCRVGYCLYPCPC